jgi:hypothetical protein
MVRVKGELLDPFEVSKGLRQGDALSLVLFNLALESVIRRMPQRQTMEVNENISASKHRNAHCAFCACA